MDRSQIDAIGFGMGDYDASEGNIDALFQVQENNYMGQKSIQLNLKEIRSTK